MYTIRVIWVGHKPPSFIDQAIDDYVRRLRHCVKLESLRSKPVSRSDIAESRIRETALIARHVDTRETHILLDENALQLSSARFAERLSTLKATERSRVNFIIGGAYGVDQDRLPTMETLSLSAMTFPHHLARLMLVEQIYRAFTIMAKHNYHH